MDEQLYCGAALCPARMGCGVGKSFVNTNRNADFIFRDEAGNRFPFINEGMNWGAEVDRTLFVMRFERLADGSPIALFVNYPMHCCLVFLNNFDGTGAMGVSGDIAGNVSRQLEKKYPGAVAVWSSGAAGDVDPVLFNQLIYPDPMDGHCVKEPIRSLEVTLQQLRMIVGWHCHDIIGVLEGITCGEEKVPIRSALSWSETESTEDKPYRIRMQTLRVGSAALVGIGGELYNAFGRQLKADTARGALGYAMDIDHGITPYGEMDGQQQPFGPKSREDLRRISEASPLPFFIKGILSVHDAVAAKEAGAAGVVISGHNNRFPCAVPPLKALPAIRQAVGEDFILLVDGGMNTGYDVFKALALGADGVLNARILCAAFVKDGPEGLTDKILKIGAELRGAMGNTGSPDLRHLNRESLILP
ncbi:MAG: alpha-hydroxy-acid oxidizing protein [Clostridia bacterium]|nr:alpha-hydroxy-acid oxidizing protein [Clostridia bacterium]